MYIGAVRLGEVVWKVNDRDTKKMLVEKYIQKKMFIYIYIQAHLSFPDGAHIQFDSCDMDMSCSV